MQPKPGDESPFYRWDGDTLVVNILGKPAAARDAIGKPKGPQLKVSVTATPRNGCLLYTSDAADDLLCVDLGGRRIIKKKKNTPEDETDHQQTNRIT